MKKLTILNHYHGKLSKNQHLNKDEQYDVPGEVLAEEAAAELVERGYAAWVTSKTKELNIEPEPTRSAEASKETVGLMSTGRQKGK